MATTLSLVGPLVNWQLVQTPSSVPATTSECLGNNNVMIGHNTGVANTGSGNVIIGSNVWSQTDKLCAAPANNLADPQQRTFTDST